MRSRPVDDWRGQIAIIVGSGPSAFSAPLELFRDRAKFIVVNESWRLAPWADALMACDEAWWDENKGLPEFKGRRFTPSPRTMKKYGIDLFCSTGTNSGLRAMYLAERLGANPICLVGFEMHVRKGVHWHEPHKRLRNPGKAEMKMWLKDTEWAIEHLKRKGIRVINCTPGSALAKCPFIPLVQVMADAHAASENPAA